MSAIDIILLCIALVALITGYIKGFVHQLGTLAGLIGGFLVCRIFGADVADWAVQRGAENAGLLRALVYAGLFLAVFLGLSLLGRLLGALLSAVKLRFIDRLGGAVFRVLLWMLFTSLVINVYLGVCPNDQSKFENPQKPWRTAVTKMAPAFLGYLAN